VKNRVFIIAEAGVNHNGNKEMALELIDCAITAGTDAVKFQTFSAEKLVTRTARKAEYQIANLGNTGGQLEMLKNLELSPQSFIDLSEKCARLGILFMSTAFDESSIDLLHKIGCVPWKIPSGEITNLPYLRRIGSFGEKIILSTGMATLGEVESAVVALEAAGTNRDFITLLHCTSEYPAPYNEVNLKAMVTMGHALGMSYGYSDHTSGIEVSIAAVALGATVIEKHFTIDKNLPGPDHKSSLNPIELVEFVRSIRNVENALGDGIKRPTLSESHNIFHVRKSIVAALPIKAGERFSTVNITTKRPGNGISPMRWDEIVGQIAKRDYSVDEEIQI
jgi:N,N'-diacetyllegionaminate synthase